MHHPTHRSSSFRAADAADEGPVQRGGRLLGVPGRVAALVENGLRSVNITARERPHRVQP